MVKEQAPGKHSPCIDRAKKGTGNFQWEHKNRPKRKRGQETEDCGGLRAQLPWFVSQESVAQREDNTVNNKELQLQTCPEAQAI